MTFLKSTTAALALGIASIAMFAAPAVEAKKEKKKKATKIKPSKAFGGLYNNGVQALEAGDAAAIKGAAAAMKPAVENDDDRFLLGSFLYNGGKKISDAEMEIEGLDLLIASPKSAPENIKIYHFQKAAVAYNGLKNYPLAAQAFTKSYELGMRKGDIEINASNAYALSNDYPTSVTWMERAISTKMATGQPVEERLYRLLISNANKAKNPALLDRSMKFVLKQSSGTDYWHDAIVLFQRNNNLQGQETLDLLRLMREAKAIKYPQQYAEYVEVADGRRYPAEVVSVLDEGFASGVISKTDITFKEAYSGAKSRLGGLRSTWDRDEKEALASSKGYLALLTADAIFTAGEYARAEKLYQAALDKGNITNRQGQDLHDRAAMRLGIAQVKQGKFAEAKNAFGKLKAPNPKAIGEYWAIYADSKSPS